MAYSIKHLFHINAPIEKVFEAVLSINGLSNWWTSNTKGSETVGGIIEFRFGETGLDMKITELIQNEKTGWECIGGIPGWIGNTLQFLFDENEGKTRVRFSHNGFTEQDDQFANSNFSWGRYLESLRQYCQTGKGEAFGSEGYRK
jgi:uncharacterized protein YndB with AHSA1/START domain